MGNSLAPGVVEYVTAQVAVLHGDPISENGFSGVAVKTAEQSWTLGIANRNQIGIGEACSIIHKGQVRVRASLISSPAKGDPLFITTADYTLSKTTGGGKLPFGRIASVAGDNRGTATGFVIVDLDARDSV